MTDTAGILDSRIPATAERNFQLLHRAMDELTILDSIDELIEAVDGLIILDSRIPGSIEFLPYN